MNLDKPYKMQVTLGAKAGQRAYYTDRINAIRAAKFWASQVSADSGERFTAEVIDRENGKVVFTTGPIHEQQED